MKVIWKSASAALSSPVLLCHKWTIGSWARVPNAESISVLWEILWLGFVRMSLAAPNGWITVTSLMLKLWNKGGIWRNKICCRWTDAVAGRKWIYVGIRGVTWPGVITYARACIWDKEQLWMNMVGQREAQTSSYLLGCVHCLFQTVFPYQRGIPANASSKAKKETGLVERNTPAFPGDRWTGVLMAPTVGSEVPWLMVGVICCFSCLNNVSSSLPSQAEILNFWVCQPGRPTFTPWSWNESDLSSRTAHCHFSEGKEMFPGSLVNWNFIYFGLFSWRRVQFCMWGFSPQSISVPG